MPKAPDQTAPGAGDPSAASPRLAAEALRVRLPPLRQGEPPFEGPLDLLLHLVKEHEVDLFDIPLARVTEAYLATLQAMRDLDIDVAGEFLAMAAQLLLMKSKLLLPRTEVAVDAEPGEPPADPRAELVRRLLEYQRYKAAAESLADRDILDRVVFARRARAAPPPVEGPDGLAEVSVLRLVEALDRALRGARPEVQEVAAERLRISDAIGRLADLLRARRRVALAELLAGPAEAPNGRAAVVATFLAVLEMARLRLLRLVGGEPGAEVVVEARDTLGDGPVAAGTEADW
ncbi:MAG TPA: segregation/condensation protein A [Anaeromyxobacteraceae bacterium]|jgi:segregation and condensation protein A